MPYAPTNVAVDQTTADAITLQAVKQLQTSRQHKRARMDQIKENENLYHGIIAKTIRNPFNDCYPFMAGFVDHLKSKIDDDSNLLYTYQSEADLKRCSRLNAFYERESKSPEPNASWNLKHRYAKYNAIFSGVAIYHYYAEKSPEYKSCLEVVSHYDFHCEPRGGGILENHLFCGQDNIFKNREDLIDSTYYNKEQVKKIISKYATDGYKDNDDYDNIRNNRYAALQQDPGANNYVGQDVYKFVQFYTTYKGKRYYVLFNEYTSTWIRVCPMTDLFPDNLYPYPTWHTNEDPDVFWSKAPCDDARGVANTINTFINQETYNRQKNNYGETHYDAQMYPNVQALIDSRPDKHVPVDTKNGTRPLSSGIFKVPVVGLNGTLELVTWLEAFTGKQIGYTSSSAGQSESDKKVGVFQGEIQQVEQLIGIKNKSYRDCLSHIGLLFKQGLEHNLTTSVSIKIMGAKGIEWDELSPEDLKTDKPLTITPVGGTSELQLKRVEENEKLAVLADPSIQVNPQWKARQMLLLKKFSEEDVKDAFSSDTFAVKELLSEAAQSEKDIVEGRMPRLNRGADSNFMQHIIDFATNTEDLSLKQYKDLMDYAMAHTDIAVENEARNIKKMIRDRMMAQMVQPQDPNKTATPISPTPATSAAPVI
jgi:hypothetical protein